MRLTVSNVISRFRRAPRAVKLLAAQQFFEGFVPIASLYAIMFDRVGHLSLNQIGWLFSIWSLAYLVMELPSGVLADYWSRRKVIIAGGLVRALGFAIWIIWPNFWGYAVGFALWGAMIACTSGAVQAYLHNELRAEGRDAQFAKYFGYVMSLFYTGALLGYGVAAVFALEHANLLIGLSVLASVAMAATLLPARERPYKKQDTYLKTLKAGFREIMRNPELRYVSVVLFSIFMTIGVLEELVPRMYASLGVTDRWVSIFVAVAFLLAIIVLARLETFVRFSLAKQVLLMCAGLALLVGAMAWGKLAASLLIILFSLVFNLFRPVFMHHVQELAHGDERATISSIPGLGAGLLGAGAYVVIGAVADATNERLSVALYAALWVLALLWLAVMGRRYKRAPKLDAAEMTLQA